MAIKESIAAIKKIKNHKLGAALGAVIMGFSGVGADAAYENVLYLIFPSADGTKEIVDNQNKNFGQLQDSINDLKKSMSSDQDGIFTTINNQISEAKDDTKKIISRLDSIKEENKKLRKQLGYQKDIKDGEIVLFVDESKYIDSSTTLAVSHIWSNKKFRFQLSSINPDNTFSGDRSINESISFIRDDGKKCILINMGGEKNMVRLSQICE